MGRHCTLKPRSRSGHALHGSALALWKQFYETDSRGSSFGFQGKATGLALLQRHTNMHVDVESYIEHPHRQ